MARTSFALIVVVIVIGVAAACSEPAPPPDATPTGRAIPAAPGSSGPAGSASPLPVALASRPVTGSPKASPADPCGRGREAMISHRDEMPETMLIGGVTADITTHALGLLNGSYDASDSVPGGIGLDPDEIATTVEPGGPVPISALPGRLVGATVDLADWAAVTWDGLANVPERQIGARVVVDPSGRATFAAPMEPGDYVVTARVSWRSTCLLGHSFGYGRIIVR